MEVEMETETLALDVCQRHLNSGTHAQRWRGTHSVQTRKGMGSLAGQWGREAGGWRVEGVGECAVAVVSLVR